MNTDALDLSQNEFMGKMALALEGHGNLPQGMCRMAAQVALGLAVEGRDPSSQALNWLPRHMMVLCWMHAKLDLARNQRVNSISHESWANLNALASKTLVPESEASKLAGAGAGTNDND